MGQPTKKQKKQQENNTKKDQTCRGKLQKYIETGWKAKLQIKRQDK
jgi:hypothetical protein